MLIFISFFQATVGVIPLLNDLSYHTAFHLLCSTFCPQNPKTVLFTQEIWLAQPNRTATPALAAQVQV
jgi:hypothetical protein